METYRLYPGGEEYEIPRLGETLENVSLAPDPQHNPLGIFLREGDRGAAEQREREWADYLHCGRVQSPARTCGLAVARLARRRGFRRAGAFAGVLVVGDDFRVFAGAAAVVEARPCWPGTKRKSGRGRRTDPGGPAGPVSEQAVHDRSTHAVGLWHVDLDDASTVCFNGSSANASSPSCHTFRTISSCWGGSRAPKIKLCPEHDAACGALSRPGEAGLRPRRGDAGLRRDLIDWKNEG